MKSLNEKKDELSHLSRQERVLRIIALVIAFASTWFFFVKLLFL